MKITFYVPGPPQPKQRARHFFDERSRTYRAVTPKKTKHYEKHVGWCALAARSQLVAREGSVASWPLDAQYAVEIDIHFTKTSTRMDVDNVVKAVLDGITGVLWKDDRQVHRTVIQRHFASPRPEVVVTVETVE